MTTLLSDVVNYVDSKECELPEVNRRFVRRMAIFFRPDIDVGMIDIDKCFGNGSVTASTLATYRHLWRRAIYFAIPDFEFHGGMKRYKPHFRVEVTRPHKTFTIPIPLPDRGIVVTVELPIDLTMLDSVRIAGVLKAYAR